jgi:3,4-dihydroxy 2-butanone 4-phosphate synthase/GTP cyclohydrolase II
VHFDEAVSAAPRVNPSVMAVLAAASRGEPVVIGRPQSCLLMVAASCASAHSVASLVRYGTGLLFAVAAVQRLDRLGIPRMAASGPDAPRLRIAIDAADGVTTGISAQDRALTLRRLADPDARSSWFTRPGHVLTVGVEVSAGVIADDASAALAVALLSGDKVPVAGYCALTSQVDPGALANPTEGLEVAAVLGWPFVAESDLVTALYANPVALSRSAIRSPSESAE